MYAASPPLLPPIQIINTLAEAKFGVSRWLIGHTNMGVAWVFNMCFSLALVAASSALIVGVAPAAVGSGIPEVRAFMHALDICSRNLL